MSRSESLVEEILFPVDFSPASVAMAAQVKRDAEIFNAKVTLLHVADFTRTNGMQLYVRTPQEAENDMWEGARDQLWSFLLEEFPRGSAERMLVSGDPAEQIAKIANEQHFGLIIMPTHSGRFRQMLLGSTTAKVLNDANCPVLTSHHAETIRPRPSDHRNALCAVALTPDSERLLRYAARMAGEVQGKWSLLHAIQSNDPDLTVQLDLEDELYAEDRRKAKERIAELQRSLGTDIPVHIAVGRVKDALVAATKASEADVLVIGRNPNHGPHGRMRDLTYSMVRDSPIPVLSI